jgi:hypothetical protein
VILEAMRRARPWRPSAPGPIDIIPGSGGAVSEDLRQACLDCLPPIGRGARLRRDASPGGSAEEFVRNLQPYPEPQKSRFWRRLRRVTRLRRRGGPLSPSRLRGLG